jgi:hypothetical protein
VLEQEPTAIFVDLLAVVFSRFFHQPEVDIDAKAMKSVVDLAWLEGCAPLPHHHQKSVVFACFSGGDGSASALNAFRNGQAFL